jgi:hypothetical protein
MHMKQTWKALAGAAALALFASAPATAQTAPAAPMGPAMPKLVLEPEAEAALNRMGATLRAMNSFEVVSDFSFERVYPGNHKLMSTGRSTYVVQQPDRLAIDMESADTHRRVLYNGKVMTVAAVKAGRYVTFPIKGSVADVLATAGYRIGESLVDGRVVVQYAFTQPGVDFQVWLDENGTQALPVKMVITNTEVPAQPQFVARYRWNQAPAVTADSFTFKPGPNDKLVDFGTAKAALAQ